jgi:hypothetical protein
MKLKFSGNYKDALDFLVDRYSDKITIEETPETAETESQQTDKLTFPIDVFPYTFTPSSRVGASKPPYINELCYGEKVDANQIAGLNLSWLIKAYKYYPKKDSFFTPFFDKLCGNSTLKQQIKDGMSEQDIKLTWQQGLTQFKKTRKHLKKYSNSINCITCS